MRYATPVDDPLFSAYRLENGTNWYQADKLAQAFACADQFQICNPRVHGGQRACTELTYLTQLGKQYKEERLGLSTTQLAIGGRFASSSAVSSMHHAVSGRRPNALDAAASSVENQQPPLPDDQWLKELDI